MPLSSAEYSMHQCFVVTFGAFYLYQCGTTTQGLSTFHLRSVLLSRIQVTATSSQYYNLSRYPNLSSSTCLLRSLILQWSSLHVSRGHQYYTESIEASAIPSVHVPVTVEVSTASKSLSTCLYRSVLLP